MTLSPPPSTSMEWRVDILSTGQDSLRERVDELSAVGNKRDGDVSSALVFLKKAKEERRKWKAELRAVKAQMVEMLAERKHRGEELDKLKGEMVEMKSWMEKIKSERDNAGRRKPGRPPKSKNKTRGVYLPK